MSLTIAEKYVAENTLALYNQVLDVGFYSLIWKGAGLMVGWDVNNKRIVSVFGDVDYDYSDIKDLEEIISHFISNEDLTNKD